MIVAAVKIKEVKRTMRPKRLFNVLLLVAVLELAAQSVYAETNAVTLQQTTAVTVIDDIQVLNATYPTLFNPNYIYDEFASVNLATVPSSGTFTFRDVIVGYYFVYDEHGIIWNYTQGQVKEDVLVLMVYSSSTAPSPHYLRLYYNSILVAAKSSNGFAHAYLFLVQAKV